MRPVFIVFARAPDTGRVKTRLAAELGDTTALVIYRALGAHTLDAVRGAARRIAGSRIVVYYTPPDGAERLSPWLGSGLELAPQCAGDLGMRMASAMRTEITRGATVAVIVGMDCPGLDADLLACAVRSLESADVVLGPACDGGYYLLAARRVHPVLFEGIPWSSPDTLGATLRAAEREGLRVALLDVRLDIDTAADWRAWLARGGDHSVRADPIADA